MSPKHINRRRFLAKRTVALVTIVVAWLAPVRGQAADADEVYRADPRPPTDGLVGANYTPAYAVNQVQFWHDFRPDVVEEELAAARGHFGISTVRVYLHNGVYLCWELMVGNSNCRCYWGSKPDSPEPTIPWCGLMWPDATPVSLAEAEAVRRYVAGRRRAMFFDDFQDAPPLPSRPGWTTYGEGSQGGSGYLSLGPGMKMVAGDAKWTDYVLEGREMLRAEKGGNAGLIVRVNDAGPGHDQMRGYYVGLDTRKLYLGRMHNNWQPLAEFADRWCAARGVDPTPGSAAFARAPAPEP